MQIYQEMLTSFAFHMDESAAELNAAGFLHADEIKEKILTEGGYAHLQELYSFFFITNCRQCLTVALSVHPVVFF